MMTTPTTMPTTKLIMNLKSFQSFPAVDSLQGVCYILTLLTIIFGV